MTQLSAILILGVLSFTPTFADLLPSGGQPHPGKRSVQQADFLFQEAMDAKKNGKSELAIEDFQKILKTYPQFKEKFVVYQELMKLYQTQKKYSLVLDLGKQAILQHPPTSFYSEIQLMRADAQLQLGKADQTKLIVTELLKSKPDALTIETALIIKAEALSQLGKHKEAFASLDASKKNEKYDDAVLKVRARACGAKRREPKQELLSYFHEKILCFKEALALAKSQPDKHSAQTWCDRYQGMEDELKKAKIDPYTLEKIKKEMDDTRALSAMWGCS
jgi:tetratricopeptide (TPR) repeat protein